MLRIAPTLLAGVVFSALSTAQFNTRLSPQTDQAFDAYVKTAEAKMDWTAGKSPVQVKDGMVHDWAKSVVAPGATMEKALAMFQDYDRYKVVFAPEVVDSRLIDHKDRTWRAWLQLRRKKVVTVVLNSEYEIEYRPLADGRWAILSRSTRISEVDDGKELAPGTGHGFLWRLNAYWLLEPQPQGLRMTCRSISLSRDIPTGLGWMVKPMVSSVPQESLDATIEAVRRALR